MTPYFFRAVSIVVAFCVGWLVYMVAMLFTTYDGALSLILQPVMAAMVSASFVGLALVFGLALRLPGIRNLWRKSRLLAPAIVCVGLATMCLGRSLGLSDVGVHPETGVVVEMLHPVAALLAYFSMLFAVANWPNPFRTNREPQ